MNKLAPLSRDPSSGVRVATALAMCRLWDKTYTGVLANEMTNENLLTGMYAIRALELTETAARPHLEAIRAAKNSGYEFTRRIALRLSGKLTREQK